MGLFSRNATLSAEQARVKREVDERTQKERELLERVALFPGSIAEYVTFRRYDVEVVDTERIDKGVSLSDWEGRELLFYLIENRDVEALVNFDPDKRGSYHSGGYGLPVRRKTIKKNGT